MFGFELSEEQQSIFEMAKDFAKNEIRPVSAHHDKTTEYPWEVLKKAHELGLMNTHVEERFGGMELGSMDGALVAEALAWGCTGISTAIEANGLALQPVIMGASDALKQKYVAPMMEELKMSQVLNR